MATANEYVSKLLEKAETNAKQYGFNPESQEMNAYMLGYILSELHTFAAFAGKNFPGSFERYVNKFN